MTSLLRIASLLALTSTLAACAATAPAGSAQPGATALSSAAPTSTAVALTSTTAALTSTATVTNTGALAVTESMAKLNISGERYATLGDPNAPITVVEFSDYGCPFCERYVSATYPQIKADFIDTGKVFYVFKDFPIVELHPQAKLAAVAAECAGDQGKYWDMHGLLFANQKTWDTDATGALKAFRGYAKQLALDSTTFSVCVAEQQHLDEIEADIALGQRLGTTGTPTFVINGKQLVGAQAYAAFRNAINNELKGKNE